MLSRHSVFAPVVILALLTAAGCNAPATSKSASGSVAVPASQRNFVRKAETVEIRMLTWDDAKQYGLSKPPPLKKGDVSSNRFDFGASAIIGTIVGLAVDFAKEQLEKEAAKHEQQFSQTTYRDDFWEAAGVPKYAGFEFVRKAKGFDQDGKEAFKLVVGFFPARYERRVVLMRPVYLKVNASAAKVTPILADKSRFTIQANVVLQTATIDKDGKLMQQNAADSTFKWPGYALDDSPELRLKVEYDKDGYPTTYSGELKDAVSGYFLAPLPTSSASTDWFDNSKGGVFKLSMFVTEKDDSVAQKYILRFAEIVGENKEAIVKAAQDVAPNGP